MSLGLEHFAGRWSLSRRIEDHRLGNEGRFRGQATFTPDGACLMYHEGGTLELDGAELHSEQRHVWRADGPAIAVSFADGRPFHRFGPGTATAKARHDCAPDLYLVTYDFSAWPIWTATWTVSGPRKDYVSRTRYTPDQAP